MTGIVALALQLSVQVRKISLHTRLYQKWYTDGRENHVILIKRLGGWGVFVCVMCRNKHMSLSSLYVSSALMRPGNEAQIAATGQTVG